MIKSISDNEKSKIKKNQAIALLKNIEHNITNKNSTFASKNSGVDKYWANPNKKLLYKSWYLILNDIPRKKLYLFYIPANSLTSIPTFWNSNGINELLKRNDSEELIDLQIAYNDASFTDTRSKVKFAKYLIGSKNY